MSDKAISRWPVGAALSIDPGVANALQQLRTLAHDILLRGQRLSVSVRLCDASKALLQFESVCRLLRDVAVETSSNPHGIELVIDSHGLRAAAAWFLRLRYLGPGSLCVMTDTNDARQLAELWQLRRSRCLRPVYAPRVLPQSPLLSNESADAVLPCAGVQVPAATAWVAVNLDITHFADRRGCLLRTRLNRALQRAVDLGEALHDEADWPTATMRHDAWLHRRLAIVVSGLGCLVHRRGEKPNSFACLNRLESDICEVQSILRGRSQQIGMRRGYLPVFDICDPTRKHKLNAHAFGFRQRWRQAVDGAAVRHRNLLVLSPWSVFPRDRPAELAYADLLPVVTHADACAFATAPDTLAWNSNEFRDFHRHASAVIAQTEARRQIAEQV